MRSQHRHTPAWTTTVRSRHPRQQQEVPSTPGATCRCPSFLYGNTASENPPQLLPRHLHQPRPFHANNPVVDPEPLGYRCSASLAWSCMPSLGLNGYGCRCFRWQNTRYIEFRLGNRTARLFLGNCNASHEALCCRRNSTPLIVRHVNTARYGTIETKSNAGKWK